jgi:hypothetical protein
MSGFALPYIAVQMLAERLLVTTESLATNHYLDADLRNVGGSQNMYIICGLIYIPSQVNILPHFKVTK